MTMKTLISIALAVLLISKCESFAPRQQFSQAKLEELLAHKSTSSELGVARRSMITGAFGLSILSVLPAPSEAKETKVSFQLT